MADKKLKIEREISPREFLKEYTTQIKKDGKAIFRNLGFTYDGEDFNITKALSNIDFIDCDFGDITFCKGLNSPDKKLPPGKRIQLDNIKFMNCFLGVQDFLFLNTSLKNCEFDDCQFDTNCRFQYCDIEDTTIRKPNVDRRGIALFVECDFHNCDFSDETMLLYVPRSNRGNSDLEALSFELFNDCTFKNVNLSHETYLKAAQALLNEKSCYLGKDNSYNRGEIVRISLCLPNDYTISPALLALTHNIAKKDGIVTFSRKPKDESPVFVDKQGVTYSSPIESVEYTPSPIGGKIVNERMVGAHDLQSALPQPVKLNIQNIGSPRHIKTTKQKSSDT